ncbi:MAG: hypothetical protein ACSHWN_08375 [Methylophilaceae bacterium]
MNCQRNCGGMTMFFTLLRIDEVLGKSAQTVQLARQADLTTGFVIVSSVR